ncbi:MAG: serine hydrolase domain-containing protein [Phormidesmis sp.]
MRSTVARRSFNFGLPSIVTAGYRGLPNSPTPASSAEAVWVPAKTVRNLDALLEVKRVEHNLPAVTAIVLSGAQIVAKGETGFRKAGTSVVVRPADRWHIGACAQAMTATMVGVLVEKGVLAWETTISEALPKLKDNILPAYHDVTLEMLLSHRAGLSQGYESPAAWRYIWKREDSPAQHRKKVAALMLKNAPAYRPGNGYAYSNMGYCIAGHIAESKLDQTWEQLMGDLIFKPLGMSSAGAGPEQNFQQIASPWGHQRNGVPIESGIQANQPAAFGPSGGNLYMSMTDWSKFVAEQLKGARGEDGQLLSASTYRRLQTGKRTDKGNAYAMGWNVTHRDWARGKSPDSVGRCLSHNGTISSWYSQVSVAPERDLAILCATNIGNRNRGSAVSINTKLNDVAWTVIGEALTI